MKPKKSKKILVIIIIAVILVIALVGVAYCYFATDIFKSNKELFFKYMGQVLNEENGMIEQPLKQYFEKQKNTPYTTQGTITTTVTKDGQQVQTYKTLNDFNISFSGQVDTANDQCMQEIHLNYSENVNFPLTYKKIKDKIGIQTEYVGSKYVTVEEEKLGDSSVEMLEGAADSIEQAEALKQIPFTQEELRSLQEKYLNVINTKLQSEQFSKIDENNRKGYKMTLTGEQLKDVLVELLETLKQDQETIDKLNEYIKAQKNSAKITNSMIEDAQEDLQNNSEMQEKNYEICVYQQKGELVEILLKIDETTIQIQKNKEGNSLEYILLISSSGDEASKISLKAKYEDLASLQSIKESYQIDLETESDEFSQVSYQYNNEINFTQNTSIEEFTGENSLLLTDYSPEQQETFMQAVQERLQSVNKQQMEEIGASESESPLSAMVMPILSISMYSSAQNAMMGGQNEMSEVAINTFNQKFEMYQSTNLKGVTVKGLLSTIARNNGLEEQEDTEAEDEEASNEYLIKEIHFDGEEYEVTEQTITLLKSSVELESEYRVEFEKDEDTGVIYRAVINKK